MNILQVLPSLDVGGVETGTVDLARYLVSKGHKAIVISSGGRLVKELEKISARHYELPVDKKSLFSVISMIGPIVDIIHREDIDLVHARSRVPAISAYFAAKLTKRLFITTAHGHYKRHLLSRPMGWGKFVIVASNIIARHMIKEFGVPFDRIRLIPRGVDLNEFRFRPIPHHGGKEFIIGMVSRITPLKGHADFLKALHYLKADIPNLKARIVGDASKAKYREELKVLARRLGLAEKIEFLGARNDVPRVMEKLDMLVSATVTPEAFGRSIIEAQAIGVPVVATAVGGVVDIIESNKTGLLCEPSNPKDLAAKILALYRDNEMQDRFSKAARIRVEEVYSLGNMMEKTLALYEEAMARQNILVIKMSALGDIILCTPSLRAIRAKFPKANIKVLVARPFSDILSKCAYIDDRVVCDFKGRDKGVLGFLRLAKVLVGQAFDIVIDFQNNKKSHLLSFLTLAPLRHGYDNGKLSFLLNRRIKDDAPYLDPVEHQFRVLKLLGIKPDEKRLELWPSADDASIADKILADNWIKADQTLVGINIRASSRWASKNWPARHIAELCDRLAKDYSVRVVLTGLEEDEHFARSVSRLTNSKPLIAAGKTSALVLASLMRRFKVFVTPDSAPMHIASSVSTPFIALFGPTDPKRHLPPSEKYTMISKSSFFKCSPCYSPRCRKRVSCMAKISVDEVFEAVKIFLGNKE